MHTVPGVENDELKILFVRVMIEWPSVIITTICTGCLNLLQPIYNVHNINEFEAINRDPTGFEKWKSPWPRIETNSTHEYPPHWASCTPTPIPKQHILLSQDPRPNAPRHSCATKLWLYPNLSCWASTSESHQGQGLTQHWPWIYQETRRTGPASRTKLICRCSHEHLCSPGYLPIWKMCADGGVSNIGVVMPEVSDDNKDGVDVPMNW